MKNKARAPRNRTMTLTSDEINFLKLQVKSYEDVKSSPDVLRNNIINSDFESCVEYMGDHSIDLLILDPPYNLDKNFNGYKFNKRSVKDYELYLEEVFRIFIPKLKKSSSIYICGEWKSSVSIYTAASRFFKVRNRITWEREKGRGALSNWKSCSEDIWFCTMSDVHTFNVEKVKIRRKIIAPYRNRDGSPKDWSESLCGSFRDTSPSNLWSDITIPFWSMPENTDHPTQKSEKLIAKLILASTNEGDCVCDPFLGSGTTAVVAKKLKRDFVAFELNNEYSLLAQKRLNQADTDGSIQGYTDDVFWERNTLNHQKEAKGKRDNKKSNSTKISYLNYSGSLFERY